MCVFSFQTHLDVARCPFQCINTSPDVTRPTPKGSSVGVNIRTCPVVMLQRITVCPLGTVEYPSLGLAQVVDAPRRCVVRHRVLHVIPDTLVNIDFAGIRPVVVCATEPERGPCSFAIW